MNADDPMLVTLRGKTSVKVVFCGKDDAAEYHAQVTGGDGVSHIHCRLKTPAMDQEVKIPALGEHMIYPTLIAAAVGSILALQPVKLKRELPVLSPPVCA